jgi:tRNA uridine 5-carboxymethylaminomethyl modification enzyme
VKSLDPIVVVGGGHAGVEAAHAAARMGADVILVTLRADALVRLSCNPAIGGIGKSHLVREIDALGGLMARAADRAGIHFRVLNRSRGPAVHGARVQQDHERYPRTVTKMIDSHPRISVVEGEAATLESEEGRIRALVLADGRRIACSALVLTTGTFLRGMLYRGDDETPGGRTGEAPALELSGGLEALGLRLGRFKTGTPPRLAAASIDFERFEAQPGDERPEPLSFDNRGRDDFVPSLPQTITYLAQTNARVHEVVRGSLDRSPLYTGRVDALGPRYCPSFEDKVVKFADKESHLLHLEPMGLEHPWIYLNGLSTSLPEEVQRELVSAIPGLESARIERFGYSVAYDFVWPTQLGATLETRALRGLFLAGQICGTTGYEEAAGLGVVAGINATLRATGREGWAPDRLESYLGVMVDDLTTRGVLEPYRMFTSRAEARLSLAPDSADRRLLPIAERFGLVDQRNASDVRKRWDNIERWRAVMEGEKRSGGPGPASPARRIRRGEDAEQVFAELDEYEPSLPRHDRETLAALLRYEGYMDRERRELEKLRRADRIKIPGSFSFEALPGLSTEVKQRLREVLPETLGQASRIPGVTPAAIAIVSAAIAQHAQRAGDA